MIDDERLFNELGDALRSAAAVPPRFVEAGRAAFTWRTVDAELAELSYDSATEGAALAGTRADPAALRALTFAAAGLTIEVEVTADALQGQVVPPQAGEIELRPRDGSAGATTGVDEVGWFAFSPVPAGLFRLHLRTADGRTVVTAWAHL